MKKRLFTVFLWILAGCILLCGCGDKTGKIAFRVNEIEVTKNELVFYMRRSSDLIIAKAESDYGLDGTKEGFWNEPMGDKTPLAVLTETAKAEIVRSKVMLKVSEKYGTKVPLTYSEQQNAWKKDNDERQAKEKSGETLYGATLRSFYTYLSLISSAAENSLKSGLKEDGTITVSDREMQEYYSSHPDYFTGDDGDFKSNSQKIYQWIFNEKFEKYIDGLAEEATVENVDLAVNPDLLN